MIQGNQTSKECVQEMWVRYEGGCSYGVFMNGNVLPCFCRCSCPAQDYYNMEVLRIQARYPAGHLAQEAVKCGCYSQAHNTFVVTLQCAGSYIRHVCDSLLAVLRGLGETKSHGAASSQLAFSWCGYWLKNRLSSGHQVVPLAEQTRMTASWSLYLLSIVEYDRKGDIRHTPDCLHASAWTLHLAATPC